MALTTAILLGIIQGVTELFPLSSLGILVMLPKVFSLKISTNGSHYLPFLVALHLGTSLALFIYFFADWKKLWLGFVRWLSGKRTADGRLFWKLIWASIPAGLVGLALKHYLAALFGKPLWAALFLVVNGIIMLVGDRWHRQSHQNLGIEDLSVRQAFRIGLFQVLALIPGLSRSGSTITGGIGTGLRYQEAARFSFLMATPIIFAAALVEVPKLHGGIQGLIAPAVVGGAVAAVTAWLSTRFLMRYFEYHRLRVFAFVSMMLGIVGLIVIH